MNQRVLFLGCWLLGSAAGFGMLAACAHGQDGHARAGNPLGLHRWAIPSDTGAYVPNLVGGGAARRSKAEAPYPDEGTWGWDYQGRWYRRNVLLGWWHGRRYQGGTGTYKTDGPKLTEPGHEEK